VRNDVLFALATLLAATLLATLAFALPGRAFAHDWYTNLKDGMGRSCCGGHDCAPVGMCSTESVGEGLSIDGKCVPIDYTKVLPDLSPDGQAHACVVGGVLRCVLLPGQT
jgi:hypothetical protein